MGDFNEDVFYNATQNWYMKYSKARQKLMHEIDFNCCNLAVTNKKMGGMLSFLCA